MYLEKHINFRKSTNIVSYERDTPKSKLCYIKSCSN